MRTVLAPPCIGSLGLVVSVQTWTPESTQHVSSPPLGREAQGVWPCFLWAPRGPNDPLPCLGEREPPSSMEAGCAGERYSRPASRLGDSLPPLVPEPSLPLAASPFSGWASSQKCSIRPQPGEHIATTLGWTEGCGVQSAGLHLGWPPPSLKKLHWGLWPFSGALVSPSNYSPKGVGRGGRAAHVSRGQEVAGLAAWSGGGVGGPTQIQCNRASSSLLSRLRHPPPHPHLPVLFSLGP